MVRRRSRWEPVWRPPSRYANSSPRTCCRFSFQHALQFLEPRLNFIFERVQARQDVLRRIGQDLLVFYLAITIHAQVVAIGYDLRPRHEEALLRPFASKFTLVGIRAVPAAHRSPSANNIRQV